MNRTDLHREDSNFVARALHKHEAALIHYVYRMTHDLEQSRDIVQDAFLKLLHEDPNAIEGYLTEWLYRVCRNRALDVRKKESRMRQASEMELDTKQSGTPSPVEQLQQLESANAAMEMLNQLPANQQEVIRLKFQQGLSYKQISSITQLSISNVGFLIHTGIKALKQKLPSEANI